MLRPHILLVLAAFAVLAVRGQTQKGDCLCAAMVERVQGTTMVYPFPTYALDDCSDFVACHAACAHEWTVYTNDGNLTSEASNGLLVGENMCNYLQENGENDLDPHIVYNYYKSCDLPWQAEGHFAAQRLCCIDGNYNSTCY